VTSPIPLFELENDHSAVPIGYAKVGARSGGQGGPPARAAVRLVIDRSEHAGTLSQDQRETKCSIDSQYGIYPDQSSLSRLVELIAGLAAGHGAYRLSVGSPSR
jgi:hypothetical protein